VLFKESIIGSLTSISSAEAGPIWKKMGDCCRMACLLR